MEAADVDQISRSTTGSGSRRGLLGALAALPLVGGLVALMDAEETAAKKRKKKKRKKKGKKKCKPQPQTTTCAGKCGAVTNNCKKSVTCGSCPTGQCCDGNGSCGSCLVFVSRDRQWGDLDGLAGADAICQDAAEAAGLPGEYLAWLSDDTDSPSTRFVQAAVPYKLINGTTVADDWDDLTSGSLAHPIDLTEEGGAPSAPADVWTNTEPNGTPGGTAVNAHCQNWTSSIGGPIDLGNHGRAGLSSASWTKFDSGECQTDAHLYCFQQR